MKPLGVIFAFRNFPDSGIAVAARWGADKSSEEPQDHGRQVGMPSRGG